MTYQYEVVIGNIGTIWTGATLKNALREFHGYRLVSQSGKGPAGGEDVTLFKDGELVKEYQATLHMPRADAISD